MEGSLVPWTVGRPRTFGRLENEMSELMERFFGPEEGLWNGFEKVEAFAPNVNLAETENAYEVTVELPA